MHPRCHLAEATLCIIFGKPFSADLKCAVRVLIRYYRPRARQDWPEPIVAYQNPCALRFELLFFAQHLLSPPLRPSKHHCHNDHQQQQGRQGESFGKLHRETPAFHSSKQHGFILLLDIGEVVPYITSLAKAKYHLIPSVTSFDHHAVRHLLYADGVKSIRH